MRQQALEDEAPEGATSEDLALLIATALVERDSSDCSSHWGSDDSPPTLHALEREYESWGATNYQQDCTNEGETSQC